MASPFPGMDPYLEDPAYWADFHKRFLNCWCEAVAAALPDHYDARMDETVNPVHIPHEFLEEVRQTQIQILHRPERTLVAVLELLSPFNKSGEGFDQYRAKRKTILLQKLHLVELDLLVGGKQLPLSKPLPSGGLLRLYFACRGSTELRGLSLGFARSLAHHPDSAAMPDAEILIDLGKVFRDTYEPGRYARSLFYTQPLAARLSRKDAQWATGVASKKKR